MPRRPLPSIAALALRPGRPVLVALGLALAWPAAQADGRTSGAANGRPRAESPRPAAAQPGHGQVFQGRASYYGHEFTGRRTANGERYEPQALTMAHRLLPFGAWVRVTNLHNQASVVVRVNDRGPFIGRRVADLSHAAAQRLRMVSAGVVQARFEVLPGPPAVHAPLAPLAPLAPEPAAAVATRAALTTVATTLGDAAGEASRSAGGEAELDALAPAAAAAGG